MSGSVQTPICSRNPDPKARNGGRSTSRRKSRFTAYFPVQKGMRCDIQFRSNRSVSGSFLTPFCYKNSEPKRPNGETTSLSLNLRFTETRRIEADVGWKIQISSNLLVSDVVLKQIPSRNPDPKAQNGATMTWPLKVRFTQKRRIVGGVGWKIQIRSNMLVSDIDVAPIGWRNTVIGLRGTSPLRLNPATCRPVDN